MISSALYNLGTNFADSGDYEQAEVYIKQAVEITEKEKLTNLPHSLFSYAKILFKQGKMNEAIQVSKKGLSAALYQGDELFAKLQGYLKALYVDAVDQQGVNQTIEYLEKIRTIHILKTLPVRPQLLTQTQKNLKHPMYIIRKCLRLKHKFKGENACMTFKKKVCLILGLSLVLVCGFGSNLTEDQTQNTFHIASDRFQT